MANTIRTGLILALAGVMIAVVFAALPADGAVISGAIHTSDIYFTVNKNIYAVKEDVYLTGGPGPNAPLGAAGLPDGWYFFQVTDPSGKELLSTDSIYARQFRVEGGIPVEYRAAYPPGYLTGLKNGRLAQAQADIQAHYVIENKNVFFVDDLGVKHYAIGIQLIPYDDTPNGGGVYKVWATNQNNFAWGEDANKLKFDYVPTEGIFGFIPAYCKTDNYKVENTGGGGGGNNDPIPTYLEIEKYYDANANGVLDSTETHINGWMFEVTDWMGVTNIYFTGNDEPIILDLTYEFALAKGKSATPPPLTYTIREILPSTPIWAITGLSINSNYQTNPTTSITIQITEGNSQSLFFLNVAFGYNPGTGHTPGFWHNINGQALIGYDDLAYVNGLKPFLNDQTFYPTDMPFDTNSEIGTFLLPTNSESDDGPYNSIPEFKLAKFFLAMSLNEYNSFLPGEMVLYLGGGEYISIGDLLSYVEDGFPWNTWTTTEINYYHNLLDSMCNNNVVYAYPTCPPIVYP